MQAETTQSIKIRQHANIIYKVLEMKSLHFGYSLYISSDHVTSLLSIIGFQIKHPSQSCSLQSTTCIRMQNIYMEHISIRKYRKKEQSNLSVHVILKHMDIHFWQFPFQYYFVFYLNYFIFLIKMFHILSTNGITWNDDTSYYSNSNMRCQYGWRHPICWLLLPLSVHLIM